MTRTGLALALALVLAAPEAGAAALRRFAVVAGNNRGGEGTRPLRFAEDDARRIYDILVRLGGVLPEDALLLTGREAPDLWKAMDRVERRAAEARAAGEQTALFIYYSGHAKDGDLRLGDSRAPLAELKRRVAGSGVEIRIAVLDACRSGAITRAKGARLAPAFEVDPGTQPGAKGSVILTSSSGDEDSQESDALQGSFFSHYFSSALLGSGDSSGDGRVTLSEAYAYAYARTVAQTAGTASGVQHPTYDYELAGNGDLVMTDVAARREGLVVPGTAPDGVYLVVDDQGAIAAEIDKRSATDRRIALAPGAYAVTRRLSDHLRLGKLHIRSGELSVLREVELNDAPFSDDPVKGGDLDVRARMGVRPLLAAGVGGSTWLAQPAGLFAPTALLGVRLDFDHGMSDHWGGGVGFSLGTSTSQLQIDGRELPFRYGQLVANGDVFYDLFPHESWRPYLGGRLAWMLLTRSFSDPLLPKQVYSTFTPGAQLGIRKDLGDHVVLGAELASHYMLYTLADRPLSLFFVELDGRLAWGF